MQLMQKEPSSSHSEGPLAAGSHFSVTRHLPSIACLRILWHPQTHVFPSVITLAKHCQFLERITACSPALGLDRHSHLLGLLLGQDNLPLDSRLGDYQQW